MSVVGIDLGTTNTVVACVRGGKVHVLADETGNRLLPSIVSFHPNGEVLTGAAAKARRVIDPKHTIANHKRIIGHSWNSPELVEARTRSPFELREGPGQGALVHVRGQDYTLPEISAFVLKRARQIAEIALGEPVERAVITVPAHFNELQRASTKVAGRISGVDVMRILNEPTAAALAYGLGRGGAERVAIYDFGGGTFDCTLLDLNGNVFEVLASAGDSFLGGDDADAAIAERMCEYILKTYRFDARTDNSAFERLKVAGEQVKMELSTKEEASIKLDDVGFGVGGAPLNVQFTLKRKDFEQMITPLVERSFKVTQDALALARLSPSSFDRVILVGGSTRIPMVRARVESFFGGKPMDKLNPDEVVAVGAAIQAAALVDATRRREIPAPPPVPGASPRTMRGTGPGAEFDDSTEGNTLSRGEPPVGATTQVTMTAPVRKPSQPPGSQRPIPGRPVGSQPPGKISQPPGKISQAPGRGSSPPGRSSPPGSQPNMRAAPPSSGGAITNPNPTLPKPGQSQQDDPSLASGSASFDLGVPSPFEWSANASTLTAQVDTDALAAKGAARPESTMSTQMAPEARGAPPGSFEGYGGADEPPSGAFGAVRDLSLVSTTGMTQTQGIPMPAPRGPAIPREEGDRPFGHVADDLSLVSSQGETSIPSIPSIQERTAPLPQGDPTGGEPAGPRPPRLPAAAGGRTVQMQGAAPPAQAPQPFAPMDKRAAATQQGIARAPSDPGRSQPPPPQRGQQGPQQGQGVSRSTAGMQQPPPVPQQAPQQGAQQGAQQGQGGSAESPSQPPQGFSSQPPGFSGFGSQPPGPAMPPPQQQPVFSGYQQQQQPPPAPYQQTFPPQQQQQPGPTQGYGQPYTGNFGGSPFGGTTEPPMHGGGSSQLQDAAHQLAGGAPVLVDVTPRALIVETAGGYADTIIPRNSKIPCERMRKFSTSRDGQTVVRIRVGQGESSRFMENTFLGEVELAGLRVAGRGDVTVAVSFELDADGTLKVRAWDTITLQEARATLQLIGMADESSVVMMINRFAQQPVGPPQ